MVLSAPPSVASEVGASPGLADSAIYPTESDTTTVTSRSATIFAEALALAQRLAEPERSEALGAIAIGYAEIHQFEQALHLIEAIDPDLRQWRKLGLFSRYTPPSIQDSVRRHIALEYARAEAYEQALQLAQTISNQPIVMTIPNGYIDRNAPRTMSYRDRALVDIAYAYKIAGNSDRALALMHRLQAETLSFGTTALYAEIARADAKMGDYNRVVAAAQALAPPIARADALRAIANVYADIGQYERIVPLIDRMPDVSRNAQAFSVLAVKLAKMGQAPTAFQVLKRIDPASGYRELAFRRIALHFASEGNIERALEVADMIERDYDQFNAIQELLTIESIPRKPLLQMARTIDDRGYRADAWVAIAVRDRKRGQAKRAERLLEKALTLAPTVEKDYHLHSLLNAIALAYADLGHLDRAKEIALRLPTDCCSDDIATILTAIAVNQAAAGQSQQALATFQQAIRFANQVENLFVKVPLFPREAVLNKIAIAAFKAGIDAQAFPPIERVTVVEGGVRVARESPELPLFRESTEQAADCPQFFTTAQQQARKWLSMGSVEQALKQARRMKCDVQKVVALIQIAVILHAQQ